MRGGGDGSVNSWKAVPKVEAPGVQKTKPQRCFSSGFKYMLTVSWVILFVITRGNV